MREIIHTDEEGSPCTNDYDDCMFANLDAPVVRSGGEPFKSYYSVEEGYYCYSAIDPSRSLVETVLKAIDERSSESNNWPACDAICVLLFDLGFDIVHLTRADIVAFWTMFPKGVSDFLSLPYLRLRCFNCRAGSEQPLLLQGCQCARKKVGGNRLGRRLSLRA